MASAVRHTRTAPSISPRMMTGVPSDSAPRLGDDHARTHSITAVPPARRARRDLVHPGRGEPRRGRQRADRDSLRAGRGQCPGAFPLGLLQAPRRPGYPLQYPPLPPPSGQPVRDRHADTLAGVQLTRQPRRFGAPLLPAPRVGRRRLGRCGLVRKGLFVFVSAEHEQRGSGPNALR